MKDFLTDAASLTVIGVVIDVCGETLSMRAWPAG